MESIKQIITDAFNLAEDKINFINKLNHFIFNEINVIKQPISYVK